MECLSKSSPIAPKSLRAVKRAMSHVCQKVPLQDVSHAAEEVILPSILKTHKDLASVVLTSTEPRSVRRRPKKVLMSSFAANMWFDLEILREQTNSENHDSANDAFSRVLTTILPKQTSNPVQHEHSDFAVEQKVMPQLRVVTLVSNPNFDCHIPEERQSCKGNETSFVDRLFQHLGSSWFENDNLSTPNKSEFATNTDLPEKMSVSLTEQLSKEAVDNIREYSILHPRFTIDTFICKRYPEYHHKKKAFETKQDIVAVPRFVARGNWMNRVLPFAQIWRKLEFSKNLTLLCESSQEVLRVCGPLKSMLCGIGQTLDLWFQEHLEKLNRTSISYASYRYNYEQFWSRLRSLSMKSQFSQWPEPAINQQIDGLSNKISTALASTGSDPIDACFGYETPILPKDPSSCLSITPAKRGAPSMGKTAAGPNSGRSTMRIIQSVKDTLASPCSIEKPCKDPQATLRNLDNLMFESQLEIEPLLDLDVDPLGFHGSIARDQDRTMGRPQNTIKQRPVTRIYKSHGEVSLKPHQKRMHGNHGRQHINRKLNAKPGPTQVVVPENMIAAKFAIDVADKSLRRRSALLLPPPISPMPSLCIIANTYLQMTGCDHRCLWLHFGPASDFEFAFQYFTEALHCFTISKDPNTINRACKIASPQSIIRENTSSKSRVRSGATARILFRQANTSSTEVDISGFSYVVVAVAGTADGNDVILENFMRTQKIADSSHAHKDTIVFVPSGTKTSASNFSRALNKIANYFCLNDAILWHSNETTVRLSVNFQKPQEVRLVPSNVAAHFADLLEQISVPHRAIFMNLQKPKRTTATPKLKYLPQNDIEEAIQRLRVTLEAVADRDISANKSQQLSDFQDHALLQQLIELHIMKSLMFHVFNDGLPVASNFLAHAKVHYAEVEQAFFQELDSKLAQLLSNNYLNANDQYDSSGRAKPINTNNKCHPKLQTILDVIESERRRMEWEDQSISAGRICKTFRALIMTGTSLSKDVLQKEMESHISSSTFATVVDLPELQLAKKNPVTSLEFYSGFSLVIFLANEYGPRAPIPTMVLQLAQANALRLILVSAESEEPSEVLSRLQDHDAAVERTRRSAGSTSNILPLQALLQAPATSFEPQTYQQHSQYFGK